MVLATRMVNKDLTLLPNITLTFDIRDTCMSVNYAIQQCTDYIQDMLVIVTNRWKVPQVL